MIPRDFSQVAGLMSEVGSHLLQWRGETEQRRVHVPAEFKTAADLRAHEMIVAGLNRLFPGVPVLSEEETWTGERPQTYWLIDPIDGTASWYEGFAGFATQAALIQRDLPVYGIVHAPALGATWEGAVQDGSCSAWRNGNQLEPLVPAERLLVCDNYPEPRRAAKILSERLPVTGYVECGSLGVKCCLVADGTADLFVKNVVVRDWDIAPVAPVLKGVGGVLSLPDGQAFPFSGPMEKSAGVLAARDDGLAQIAIAALSERER